MPLCTFLAYEKVPIVENGPLEDIFALQKNFNLKSNNLKSC